MRIIDQVFNSEANSGQMAAPAGVMPSERNVNDPWEPGDGWAGAATLPGGGVGTGVDAQPAAQPDTSFQDEEIFDFADVDEMLNGNAPRDLSGGFGGWEEGATASAPRASSIEDIFAGTGFSDLEEVAIDGDAGSDGVEANAAATANSQNLDEWINDFMRDIDAHEQGDHGDYTTDYGYDDGLFG